ncbi:hypothetical protein N7516_008195 [Penicillium verrucosum]|uniref:uncharacterized protein n=1 Tax=Penicillium verrucosum TaxID=60171 RepID=UPI00254594DE|nr:uncharacterized protein N7516_008195 [Penicillium verrucosum]KAJ5926422.1 hypothetical protein N7516_008195 [Penicillium verrucosum]
MSSTYDPSNPFYKFYKPSIPAAIAVAVLFLAVGLVHLWRIIRTRQWFGIVILVAAAFEVVGLVARVASSKHLEKELPYEIQTVLILLAPILYAAVIYMFLGRLILKSGYPELSFIRIKWLTPIFVTDDIFCFFVQAAGVVILLRADSKSKFDLAKAVILAGLALQVLFFGIFALVAVLFHIRFSSRHGGNVIRQGVNVNVNIRLWNLYICSLLITVRNIYRLVEYATGTGAYLSLHEWPAYVLDIGLMFIIMVLSIFWYFPKTTAPGVGMRSEYPLAEQGPLE